MPKKSSQKLHILSIEDSVHEISYLSAVADGRVESKVLSIQRVLVNGLPPENSQVLDGQVIEFDGLKIAGISGIVGNPKRPGRRRESDFLNVLDKLLKQEPHLLVLHESPKGDRPDQLGNPEIAELLNRKDIDTVVVSGHCYWN